MTGQFTTPQPAVASDDVPMKERADRHLGYLRKVRGTGENGKLPLYLVRIEDPRSRWNNRRPLEVISFHGNAELNPGTHEVPVDCQVLSIPKTRGKGHVDRAADVRARD